MQSSHTNFLQWHTPDSESRFDRVALTVSSRLRRFNGERRDGEFDGAVRSRLLSVVKGDVASKESLGALIAPGRLGGVIYAASASRQKEAKKPLTEEKKRKSRKNL